MALNLDTALRVVAKVSGLNDFKALADSLQSVEGAGKNAGAGLQQTANESGRVSQEAAKAAGTVKAQATALQDLQAKTRASAAEMRRMGSETSALGGVVQRLRGQTGGVFDGLTGSSLKAANNIRSLQQTIQPAEGQIAKLRGEILQLGAANKQTERSIEQQVAALKTLRSQAEVNGTVYQALSGDIAKLQGATKGLDSAAKQNSQSIAQQIQSLTALQTSLQRTGQDFGATGQQIDSLKRRAAELGQAWEPGIRGLKQLAKVQSETVDQQAAQTTRLQGVLSKAGEGYQRLGREIDALKQKAAGLDLSKGLQVTPGGVASGVTSAVGNIVQMRRDLAQSMMGRVVLTGEGLATAGVAGAAGMGAASGLGGLAGGAQAAAASLDAIAAKAAALPGILKPLGGLLSEPASAAAAGVSQWAGALTAAQGKLAALSAPFEAIGTAISSIGPEAAAAAGVASLAIAGVYQVLKRQADDAQADLEQSYRGISDGAQKVLQDLVRIYDRVPNARLEAQQQLRDRNMQRLGEVPSDSVEARRAANAVVSAEREIAKIQGEQAQLLDRARTQQDAASVALKAQVQTARDRLEAQRQLTAETKRTAEEERNARAIARSIARNEERTRPEREALAQQQAQLEALRNQARTRLELQQQQTAAVKAENQALAEQRAIAGSIRRNQERVAVEQDRLRRAAAAAFPAPTTLALPAAGGSSFRGDIDSRGFGGGARARINGGESPLIMATDRAGRQAYRGGNDYAGPQFGINSNAAQALQQQAQAAQQTRGRLAELFLTIDKVTASSNGSIQSLQRQRSAWEALRLAVNPAAPAYATATAKVKALDEQLQKLNGTQQSAAREGIGRQALGGALGTLATGGGLQGAVGAAAGSLAFSGGEAGLASMAGGLAAGAALAGVGAIAALASRVGIEAETAQVRLKALTDQFGEYNQAQEAAARISGTLRISLVEAQDGFGKLYAALRPTGVTLQEIEDAFIGFTAAARASGATAVESSAALLQLKQALGSGVLQGDELGRIREQAPAVGQAIAREMGVTIGELKKLGSEGQITTDIVLRALAKLKNEKLGQLNEQFNTAAQAQRDLQNATQKFGVEVSKAFGPAVVGLIRVFTGAVNLAADALDRYNRSNTEDKQRALAVEAAARRTGTRNQWDPRFRAAFNQELARIQGAGNSADPTSSQQEARSAAAAERNAARARAAQAAADESRRRAETEQKKAEDEAERQRKAQLDYENDLFNIRLNAEKRLREFREQSLERAKQMERDLADQRLKLERTTEERRRRAMGLLQDAALMGQIAQVRAGGGDPSGLEQQLRINQERRRVAEEILKNDQDAADRRIALDRSVEAYRLSVAEGIAGILREAGKDLEDRMRQGAQAAAGLLGGATGPMGALLARIRSGEGDYISINRGRAGDTPGGMPSLTRMTVGQVMALQSSGRAFAVGAYQFIPETLRGAVQRSGIDFGARFDRSTQDRLAIELILGGVKRPALSSYLTGRSNNLTAAENDAAREWAALTGSAGRGMYDGSAGNRGSISVRDLLPLVRRQVVSGQSLTSTPQGPANSIRSLPSALRPAVPLQPMDPASTQVPGMEGINAGASTLGRLIDASRSTGRLAITAEDAVARRSALADVTSDLDAQSKSIRDQVEDYQRLLVLQRSGLSPEIAQQRVEAERAAAVEAKRLQRELDSYELTLKDKDLSAEVRAEYEAQAQFVRDRLSSQVSIIDGLTAEQRALQRLRDLEAQRQQLIEGISGTIGNGLSSAIDGLISGTESWGDSLRNIAATVLKDIARQLAQIYLIQPATQGLQGLLGGLLGGGGGAAAAGAFNPSVYTMPMLSGVPMALGGIMTDAGPLPLRAYSRGGIASSPQLALFGEGRQPEAFVPLPDGRRIPVAMRGGGGSVTTNNVTVNVDATGSNVQSDDQQGRELGRVIAAAVQSELVKQKRPGGILTR